jgi:1-deoxy-D-xylulose 5-phosphate reductoisomerase
MTIGQEGLRNADPDWRIPYYMALNYFVTLKDPEDALKYFDLAAQTPGVPDYARRFALNFGSPASERKKTEELWTTIRDSSNDPATKNRAQAYIDRLEIFDYLEAAVKAYQQKNGMEPTSLDQLVQKGVIPEIPQDPFGYTFILNKDGTVGIDLDKPPINVSR